MRLCVSIRHKKAPIKGLDICTVVPRVGIEPTLPKEPDFESGASTSSATPATHCGAGLYMRIGLGFNAFLRIFQAKKTPL